MKFIDSFYINFFFSVDLSFDSIRDNLMSDLWSKKKIGPVKSIMIK